MRNTKSNIVNTVLKRNSSDDLPGRTRKATVDAERARPRFAPVFHSPPKPINAVRRIFDMIFAIQDLHHNTRIFPSIFLFTHHIDEWT